ncbi:proline-rich protein 2-like [Aedes albopictus]|uniref:Uncharacterized protein n=1 Tax=Aedes albopictus TaxID=7160 RepID=A0ABM1Y4Q0_AEDAL
MPPAGAAEATNGDCGPPRPRRGLHQRQRTLPNPPDHQGRPCNNLQQPRRPTSLDPPDTRTNRPRQGPPPTSKEPRQDHRPAKGVRTPTSGSHAGPQAWSSQLRPRRGLTNVGRTPVSPPARPGAPEHQHPAANKPSILESPPERRSAWTPPKPKPSIRAASWSKAISDDDDVSDVVGPMTDRRTIDTSSDEDDDDDEDDGECG